MLCFVNVVKALRSCKKCRGCVSTSMRLSLRHCWLEACSVITYHPYGCTPAKCCFHWLVLLVSCGSRHLHSQLWTWPWILIALSDCRECCGKRDVSTKLALPALWNSCRIRAMTWPYILLVKNESWDLAHNTMVVIRLNTHKTAGDALNLCNLQPESMWKLTISMRCNAMTDLSLHQLRYFASLKRTSSQ